MINDIGIEEWRKAVLSANSNIQQVVKNLNDVAIQITLIADDNGVLIGTVSDGDIRRGLLKGLHMNSSIESIINKNPFVVPETFDRKLVPELMQVNKIKQIPVVDSTERLVGLYLWDQVAIPANRKNLMIIMAGGKGTRLRPHTENCPKPMLKVDGKPMLQHIIERAKTEGFSEFLISVHYLHHIIEDYFGAGEKFGVKIGYLREESPLGTAGALSLLILSSEQPFVVTNGDVITDIRYGEVLDFHNRYQAIATMAVSLFEWKHPFGVVQMNGVDITGFEEKPVLRSHINAGVYVLSPKALKELDDGMFCDMPSLFKKLQTKNMPIVAYPMHEPWLDVGRPEDLKKAILDK